MGEHSTSDPTQTEGILFIDIIDGKGERPYLARERSWNALRKSQQGQQIDKFVSEILKQYPPQQVKKP